MILPRALLLALAALSAGACHRTQTARLPVPPVPLAIPDPPSRIVIPVTLAEYEPPPPPPEPEPAPPPVSRPASNRPAERPTPPPSPPAADAPAPVLQTTTNPNASEQRVIARLQAADRDLKLVPFNQLSPSGKEHYQLARSFMQQATDALKINNYNFADYLADKAAQLAASLVKR